MKFATSAGVALGLSFLFYDQRDVGEGVVGQREEVVALTGEERAERSFLSYGAGYGGGKLN